MRVKTDVTATTERERYKNYFDRPVPVENEYSKITFLLMSTMDETRRQASSPERGQEKSNEETADLLG